MDSYAHYLVYVNFTGILLKPTRIPLYLFFMYFGDFFFLTYSSGGWEVLGLTYTPKSYQTFILLFFERLLGSTSLHKTYSSIKLQYNYKCTLVSRNDQKLKCGASFQKNCI